LDRAREREAIASLTVRHACWLMDSLTPPVRFSFKVLLSTLARQPAILKSEQFTVSFRAYEGSVFLACSLVSVPIQ
jgi:hypothetical protein